MPATWKDGRESEASLPDPRLNPMINPRLGKNLGRWANVYYTTPAERRDQAVLELVRELEDLPGEGPKAGVVEEQAARPIAIAQASAIETAVSEIDTTHHRFCLLCGSPVQKHDCAADSSPDRVGGPAAISNEGSTNTQPLREDPKKAAPSPKRHSGRKQLILVLLACTLLTAWSVSRIGPESAVPTPSLPLQGASLPPPIAEVKIAAPAPTNVASREAGTSKPAPPIRHPQALVGKPSAGRPIECGSEHLKSCPVNELYKKTMVLASGIDSLFVAYDRRMIQLLGEARKRRQDSASQKQSRLRRANLSAQAWERVQLASYTSHDKVDALRFRAELMRRVNRAGLGKERVNVYEHPQSCLDLHYVAGDLRRLAAELRKPRYGNRASVR